MVEMEEDAVFPVVLYDGQRETDVGDVKIRPTLDFKRFQTILSQMIGISYNNLTTYLVDDKSQRSSISPERLKILITGKVNFSVLVREKNCYFLVVLKRSRRDRRRKPDRHSGLEFLPAPVMAFSSEDLLHIRLNQLDMHEARIPAYGSYYYDDRFHELQMQRENYMNMMLNSNYGYVSPLTVDFPRIEEAYPSVQSRRSRALCKECTEAEKQGKTAAFHLCVYDDIVPDGFRSPAGPICRPR